MQEIRCETSAEWRVWFMGNSTKDKIDERKLKILDTAFDIFVEKTIEAVSMGEIAEAAGVGRATLFRYYPSKLELVIEVCGKKWKDVFDKLDESRPISSVGEISALDRLIFTLDSYIEMYQNYKELLCYNDNFNHYVSRVGRDNEHLAAFHESLYSVNVRLHNMFEKAKEDKSFRTDIPEGEFLRVTVQTMMGAGEHYAKGFIWGSEKGRDYTPELLRIKEMILRVLRYFLTVAKEQSYPMVQIALHTGTADTIFEMMNKGLVDIGLFMEPVNTEGLAYIRLPESDCWVVGMRPDDPLAQKEVITKEDLFGLPLILPERIGVQSELANWFGKDLAKLRVAFTSNLGTNAGVMAMHGLGYPVSIEGAAKYWGKSRLIQKHLYPEIKSGVIMAWRRNIPYSQAVQKMIEKMQEFEASEMSKRRRS